MQSVLLAASKDPNAKMTVLLLPPGARRPTLAVKVATTEAAERVVDDEARVLAAVHRSAPHDVRATIPRAIGLVEANGRRALVMTAVVGTPMTTTYHHWGHTRRPGPVAVDFAAAGGWLARLQHATAGPRTPLEMDDGVRTLLMTRFASEPYFEELDERLAAIHDSLHEARTPRTTVHGDFWHGNVLVVGEQVTGVVDWEGGALEGEPVRDVVRFALAYACYLDRHTRPGRPVHGHPGLRAGVWGAGLVYAIDGDGWFPTLFRNFLARHLERLGAPRELWRDAALAGLADIAARADEPQFALRHLELLRHLCGTRGGMQ